MKLLSDTDIKIRFPITNGRFDHAYYTSKTDLFSGMLNPFEIMWWERDTLRRKYRKVINKCMKSVEVL